MYAPALARDSLYILAIFCTVVALITSANLVADAIDKFDNYWPSQYALFVTSIVGLIFLPVPATFFRYDQATNKAMWFEIAFLGLFMIGFGGLSIFAAIEYPGSSYCVDTGSYCPIYKIAQAFAWIVASLLLFIILIDCVWGFKKDRRAVFAAEEKVRLEEKKKGKEAKLRAEELVPGLLKKKEKEEEIEEVPVVV